MRRGLCLLTVALAALSAPALMPALAQSACVEPEAPNMPDGSTAPAADIRAAAEAVRTFVAKSDEYQGCLNAEYQAMVKQLAKDRKDLDPKLNTEREGKINANQLKKEQLGQAYAATAAAYRQAHPPAAK